MSVVVLVLVSCVLGTSLGCGSGRLGAQARARAASASPGATATPIGTTAPTIGIAAAPAAQPAAQRRNQVVKHKLKNGLTVILEENQAAPVVAFQAWVGVGSTDETADEVGLAHVFEHMLFKGTARRGVGQIAQEVENAGGDINAWTSYDETVYHLVLASRFFDTGLDIIADALQNASFDPEELERELRVVLEEIKQGEDNPSRVATEEMFATAFHRHPYRRPVIGTASSIRKITRQRLLSFFRRTYVPNNITLVVVGDFESSEALRRIEQAFAGAVPRPLARPAHREPEQRAPRVSVLSRDIREAHVTIAFHIPGIRQDDAAAVDVGTVVLGQGESSRLSVEVKRNRQLVTDVYAYSYTPRDPGLLVVGATLPAERVEEAVQALLREAFRMSLEQASPEEVRKAQAILDSDTVYQKETVQGQARKLGFFEVVGGDLGREESYQRQVASVSPGPLREVMARYLRPENATITVLLPQAAGRAGAARDGRLRHRLLAMPGEAHATMVARRQRALRAAGRATGATAPAAVAGPAEVVRFATRSGIRVIVKREASVPLVALRAVWMGGTRYEDARNNGVNNLLAGLVTKGTQTQSAEQLAREIEGMAGAIGGFSGRNSFGLRAELLAKHWERGLEIFADCVLHPVFAEAELEKEQRQVLEELRAQEDNLTTVTFRLLAEGLYPGHPYRLDISGTPETVAALSRRQLLSYYRRHFGVRGMTLAVVGDVDPDRLAAKLEDLFGDASGEEPPPAIAPREPRRSGGPTQTHKHLAKQQAHIALGYPGTTVAGPDRFALEVLATILSGQGGRLFVELRDRQGLAYRLSAFSMEGVDPGYFAVYIATSPSNVEVSLAAIREQLDRLKRESVPAAELERTKRYLVGSHEISLQRRSALASTLAFNEAYGLGWQEYRRYAPAVLSVSAADVQRVARAYLDPSREVVAMVRPEGIREAPAVASAAARRRPAVERPSARRAARGSKLAALGRAATLTSSVARGQGQPR